MEMFCNQCQEAAKGVGCTIIGVCGKKPIVANELDLLTKATIDLAQAINDTNSNPMDYENILTDAMFTAITNVNFDDEAIKRKIKKILEIRNSLKKDGNYLVNEDEVEHITFKKLVADENEDIASLKQLLLYGLRGMCAYTQHANVLGEHNEEIIKFLIKGLLAIKNKDLSLEEALNLVNECGKYGVEAMALLDKANTSKYGNPEVTEVNLGVRNNPGILVSGHDLKDLEMLLEQTKGTGVDVYTHGEMLPAHYYPFFKKYDNFVGNYGSAWYNQVEEFASFNGPVLFTTNCIVPKIAEMPYADKIFTTGSAGLKGAKYIPENENGYKDFSEIIEVAKKCPPPKALEEGKIIGGFAHNQVLALADKVVEAVKSGAIKKFVVMAGCDGRMKSREYYTEFAKTLPKDTVILTAGCAKYRYNKLPLGDINGIPRVLDAGQCNDSYSLAVIALKLKEVFGLDDVNKLPIVYNIAWYEQKAVIVLLALLYLGVKNIHLGPTLPAFLSPNVAKVLVEQFGIAGIKDVETDIKELILA